MTCPICKSATTKEFRPFCSRRCADLDLGRWFTGAYALPSEEQPDDDGTPVQTAEDSVRRRH